MADSSPRDDQRAAPNWRLRIALSVLAVLGIVLTYATIYRWAMATYEGVDVAFYEAVQVVIESLTTAGFGGQAPWESAAMNVLVLLMNLSGVLLMFLALPVFLVPMIREALNDRPPTETDLEDHVVVAGHSRQDEVLRRELDDVGEPHLFVDPDPETVLDLAEDGIDAVVGDPEETTALRAANADRARALVADVDDRANPTVILSARRVNEDLRIASVVRDPESSPPHRFAGADEVVEAKDVLGESLALRAMRTLSEQFREAVAVETDLEIAEVLIDPESDLAGRPIGEVDAFQRLGITVIGGWFGGKFVVSPDPSTTLRENAILLVAGRYDDLEDLTARPLPGHHEHPSRVVVCGYGTVGRATVETLENAGVEVDVVDARSLEGVDVVGDVTDAETLERAALDRARSVVLALDDDVTAIYAALAIGEIAPDVEIVARANDSDNAWKLYNAGVDYVLSLPMVAGEMLASLLIEDREILTPHHEFEFVRTDASALAGQTLAEADVRAETGCTVVAVERGGDLVTNPGADFQVEDGDVLVAVGTPEATDRLRELTGGKAATTAP